MRRLCLLILLVGCSHEAKRENPLDPELTPPVDLTASLNDTSGTAELTWTGYTSGEPFDAYLVLRREGELARWDTLARLTDVGVTSFSDTLAANTSYAYRISVINRSGFEATTAEHSLSGFQVSAPALVAVEVDSLSGAAQITWHAFTGPRFVAYRIERRAGATDDWEMIAETSSVRDTVLVDAGLQPQVSYIWRVVTIGASQEWEGAESNRELFLLQAVQLLGAVPDSLAGNIQLRWSGYVGPAFENYRVLRRQVGTDQQEEIATLLENTTLSVTDTTARTDVSYLYWVEVTAAGLTLESSTRFATLILPGVEITQLQASSEEASIQVSWHVYVGPRFLEYRLMRRARGVAEQEVARVSSPTDTTYVDVDLDGATIYDYWIEVVTRAGEQIVGRAASDGFHLPLASWDLDLAEDDIVRLYGAETGVRALVAGPQRVSLHDFDDAGQLLQTTELLSNENYTLVPSTVAWAQLDEDHLLSYAIDAEGLTNRVFASRFDASGGLQFDVVEEHIQEIPEADGFDRLFILRVGTQTGLSTPSLFEIDNLTITAAGEHVVSEDFSQGASDIWASFLADVVDGRARFQTASPVGAQTTGAGVAALVDDASTSLEYGLTMYLPENSSMEIQIGGISSSAVTRIQTEAESRPQGIRSTSSFRRDGEIVADFLVEEITDVLPYFPLHLESETDSGVHHTLRIRKPYLLSSQLQVAPATGAIAVLQSQSLPVITMAGGNQRLVASTIPGNAGLKDVATGSISDIRVWRTGNFEWIGYCSPSSSQVLVDWTLGMVRFTGTNVTSVNHPKDGVGRGKGLSQGFGSGRGQMTMPISMDGSPDGRIYVLDVGNTRIQVYNLDGEFITQWGRAGTALGEFDFRFGISVEDFSGSVAVDDDGFIYVADVGNQRIQKFAP